MVWWLCVPPCYVGTTELHVWNRAKWWLCLKAKQVGLLWHYKSQGCIIEVTSNNCKRNGLAVRWRPTITNPMRLWLGSRQTIGNVAVWRLGGAQTSQIRRGHRSGHAKLKQIELQCAMKSKCAMAQTCTILRLFEHKFEHLTFVSSAGIMFLQRTIEHFQTHDILLQLCQLRCVFVRKADPIVAEYPSIAQEISKSIKTQDILLQLCQIKGACVLQS